MVVQMGDVNVVRAVLDLTAPEMVDAVCNVAEGDVEACPTMPLFIAVAHNHVPVVAALLEHNASLELSDSNGDSALHVAARHGKEPMRSLS